MTVVSGMLFAKVDVCFWSDKRFDRAGLEASCYWVGVLTWLRQEKTEDAVIPFDQVGKPRSVGPKKGRQLCEKLASPEVGLFAKRSHGYELLLYREKGNELRADIEARQVAGRERSDRWRRNASGDVVGDASPGALRAPLRDASLDRYGGVIPGVTPSRTRARARSDSDSDSSGSGEGESREGGQPTTGDTHVRADDPLPDFSTDVAAAVGLALGRAVRDVPAEWLKFAGHYAGQCWRSDVRARWQKWLTKAAQDQAKDDRVERERGERGGRRGGPELVSGPRQLPVGPRAGSVPDPRVGR